MTRQTRTGEHRCSWQTHSCCRVVLVRLADPTAVQTLRTQSTQEESAESTTYSTRRECTHLYSGLTSVLYVSFGLPSYHAKNSGKLSKLSASAFVDIFTPFFEVSFVRSLFKYRSTAPRHPS